jgi:hypothetical protein
MTHEAAPPFCCAAIAANSSEHTSGCPKEGEPVVVREKWRANYVPAPHYYALNMACVHINQALGHKYGCYLVGSSLTKRDYRDVDVRYIMDNEGYDKLFKNETGWTNALWSLMCVTISDWLSKQSGLPIDFQIQRQAQANEAYGSRDGHKRSALGIFLDYPGERPTDVMEKP